MVYAVNRVLGATCMVYCSRTLRPSTPDPRVSTAVVDNNKSEIRGRQPERPTKSTANKLRRPHKHISNFEYSFNICYDSNFVAGIFLL